MKKTLRGSLTYANVVSTLCLFLLLGGGAAFAASHLGKNSVGAKQLKKNAVTTPKIRKNAVTTAKIGKEAVTGAKIKLSSLGTVPAATNATNAAHANAADAATNAGNLAAPEAIHVVGASGEPLLKTASKISAPQSHPSASTRTASASSISTATPEAKVEWRRLRCRPPIVRPLTSSRGSA